MPRLFNAADLDSGNGKTFREINSETKHKLSVGQLIELKCGARLLITRLVRDCDDTPLYFLGLKGNTLLMGYAEDSLKAV